MRNQIAAADRMGLRAVTINSDNRGEWDRVEAAIARDEVDILLISPERLANERFRTEVLANVAARIALLIIDEAHCISEWGHDFRPQYRLIERIARTLPANLRLLATTATANDRVLDDLRSVLGPDLSVRRTISTVAVASNRLPQQASRHGSRRGRRAAGRIIYSSRCEMRSRWQMVDHAARTWSLTR
jgi:ATP-dependent DNA helicase RecQ